MTHYNFTNLSKTGGVKTKLSNNINAVKLLRQLEQSQRFPTEIERDILAKFTGWGTVASVINREVLELLPNTDLNSDNAFQTPHFIIEAVWEVLEQLGFKSGRIADPAANIGLWAGFQKTEYRTNSEWLLVEIDPTAKTIAQYLHPDAIVYGSNYQQQIGFEHTDIPKDSFDLVVSNFPFGVTPPFDPKYQKVVKTLHNYFWAKSLALTTPGGLIASITSVGTMDSTPEFCQYLAAQGARLIGAVRLPNTAFKSMNTSVTADLIILQKMTEPQNADTWGEVVDSPIKDKYNVPLKINRYFAENPDKVIGKLTKCVLYAGERIAVAGDSCNLKQRIIDAFSNIEPCYTSPKHVKSLSQNLLPAEFVGLDPYRYVSRQGKIYQYRPGEGLCLVTQNAERIAAGLGLKQTLDNLIQAEIKEAGEQGAGEQGAGEQGVGEEEAFENGNLNNGNEGISTNHLLSSPTPYSLLPTPSLPTPSLCEILRSELNRLYQEFVKRYGELLNRHKRPSTLSVFSDDSELTTLCYALEEEVPGEVDLKNGKVKGVRYKKADIFTTRISGNLRKSDLRFAFSLRERKISSPIDAVYDCLDRKGYLDLKFIALLLDKTEADTIATLKTGEIGNLKTGETGNLETGETTNPKLVETTNPKLVETGNPKPVETPNNKQSFIFYDIQLQRWVIRDEYLSGDTRTKLQMCRTCKDIDPEAYNKFWLYDNETQLTKKDEFGKYLHLSPYLLPPASETIRAEIAHRLKANSDIDSYLESNTYIDGGLGVPWIESEQIAQFIAKILHCFPREVRVSHVPELGLWSVTGKPSCREAAIKSEYAANRSDGKGNRDVFWLIEQTLNQSPIKIQVFDNETLDRKASTEATDIAIAQIERLKKEFKEWLWSDIERAYHLTVKYNNLYPLPQKRIFDGSYLSLPDSNTKIQLKPHQLNGIARAIQTKRLLTLWEVGTGKSYQIFASAYESQRLGIAQKPIIVALNSTLSQMVAGFRNLYPNVKLLVIDDNIAGRSTGSWQERNKLIAKIQTGRYDAILLTHTQFFSIPISNQTKLHYIQEQLELVERYLAEAKGDKFARPLVQELRRQQESLHQQIDELEVREKVSTTDANSREFQELVLDLLADETWSVNASGCLEYVKPSKRNKSKQAKSTETQFTDSQLYQETESKETQVTDSQFYQKTQNQETESNEIQVTDSQLYQETQSQETQFADSQLYQETESKKSQFADSQLYQETQNQETQVIDSQLYQETQSQETQFADSQLYQETESKEARFVDSQLYQKTQSKQTQVTDSQLYQETKSKESQFADSQPCKQTESQEIKVTDSQFYQETQNQETQNQETQVTDSQIYQKTQSKPTRIPDSQSYQNTQIEPTRIPDSQFYQNTQIKPTQIPKRQLSQKQRDKKRDSLNNSLERATQYYTRNSVGINWEDLGCQWVWFDEIHAAKNIPFASKAQGIAGIANVDTQRSLNTLLKYRFMFDKGYFIGGGTGTLPSNSLTEVFNMMRLFCPDLLHSTQTEHFDSWLGQYGEITTSLEFTSTGGIKSKTRVASFKNLWELMSSLSVFTDFVTADSAKIERPILHRHTITAPMNGTQLAITQNIKSWMERWQRKQPVSYGKADGKLVAHNPLTLTSLGSLSSIDSRLVDPNAVVHKETKLHQLIHNVLWIYRVTNDRLGTQIIFRDSGVPKATKRGKFDVYNYIRDTLVALGIPANQIAFVHEFETEAKRLKLYDNVNTGRIRILIGSTLKAGTGLNVQRLCIALHHLDLSWTPANLIQRRGRGHRQGNLWPEIWEFTYGTSGLDNSPGFDAYKANLVRLKAEMSYRIMSGNVRERHCEDVGEDASHFLMAAAILSGNSAALNHAKITSKMRQKEADLVNQQTALGKSLYALKTLAQDREVLAAELAAAAADLAKVMAVGDLKGDGFRCEVQGIKYDSVEQAGNALIQAIFRIIQAKEACFDCEIGEIAGLGICVTYIGGDSVQYVRLRGAEFEGNSGKQNTFYHLGNWNTGRGLISCLRDVVKDIKGENNSGITIAQNLANKLEKFNRDAELLPSRVSRLMQVVSLLKDELTPLKVEELRLRMELVKVSEGEEVLSGLSGLETSEGEDVKETSAALESEEAKDAEQISAASEISDVKSAEKLEIIECNEEDLVPAPGAAVYSGFDADIVKYILSLGEPTTVDEEGNLVTWIDKMESLELKLDVVNLASIEEAKQQLEKTLELKTEEKGKSDSLCSPAPCSPAPHSPAPSPTTPYSLLPTPYSLPYPGNTPNYQRYRIRRRISQSGDGKSDLSD